MRLLSAYLFLLLLASCASQSTKEERLAKQHCSSCHMFPEPALLDKTSWEKSVLPQMAFRMSVDLSPLLTIGDDDYDFVVKTLPPAPMISVTDFESIKNYYTRMAPDSLSLPPDFSSQPIDQFEVLPLNILHERPTLTLLEADTVSKKIYVSTRKSKLYTFDYQFKVRDSILLNSPVSDVMVVPGKEPMFTLMGIMDPNDQPRGKIGVVQKDNSVEFVIDSLKRPVHLESVDLNGDQLDDIVVCAFGNYGGALLAYQNMGQNRYIRHVVNYLPGSRKVIIRDFNNDGLPDILALMTQGDEQISLYTNAGNFRFRITTLLRFPPMNGSSYFDIADFNHDGKWDILYTNGDNADYSIVLKPYHGVHIYLNDGNNQFKESWFHQMYGCSMAMARDFDQDGDLDVAAISFFPDFKKTPERSFVYFQNSGKDFQPFTTELATKGRWLLMETLDYDSDGDEDIFLGALDFYTGVPESIVAKWTSERTDVLLLKNNRKK